MKNILREILSTSIYILCVLIATYLIIHFVGQRTEVIGSSMVPTLQNKDNLIVEKISYRFQDPKRFDIIVFPYKYAKRTYYIKRIIGLPGEKVYIDEEGNIYINDVILEEHYGKETIQNAGLAATAITLEDDEYFVMGDNRNDSSDSRDPSVGNIRRGDIIGRAWVRIWPFDKFGKIPHQ